MRLFISGSQQHSAAAPNRLFANYSANITRYDLPGFCERALDITPTFIFSPLLCRGKALCVCVSDTVKDITLSSIEVTKQSEMDLHRRGVCFLALFMFRN